MQEEQPLSLHQQVKEKNKFYFFSPSIQKALFSLVVDVGLILYASEL